MGRADSFAAEGRAYATAARNEEDAGHVDKAKELYIKAAEAFLEASKVTENQHEKELRKQFAEMFYNRGIAIKRIEIAKISAKEEGEKTARVAEWIPERPNIKFDDVAGLDDVKKVIKTKLIYPFLNPEKAKEFGVTAGGGILLYGPPGTGKTMIAKAIATEVDAIFFTAKPSQIMSQWVGVAEKNIEQLFSAAKSHGKAVIFIDEIESLLPKRGGTDSTVMKRVVPQFLAELEGFESESKRNVLFLGASNVPWEIDDAALRPGRFDKKIYIPLPDLPARKKIFELYLRNKPVGSNINIDKLAETTDGYSGADVREICADVAENLFMELIESGRERKIEMQDLLNTLARVKPSVDKKMLDKFIKFGS